MSDDKEIEYIKMATNVIAPTMVAILQGREHDFTDDTYDAFEGLIGADVAQFIASYTGGNGFLNQLKAHLKKGKGLSLRQKRAAANIIRRALRGEDLRESHGFKPSTNNTPANQGGWKLDAKATSNSNPAPVLLQRGMVFDNIEDGRKAIESTDLKVWECYTCHKYVVGSYEDLTAHKANTHSNAAVASYGTDSKNQREVRNAFVRTEPTLQLDIRAAFPEQARFAVPQSDGSTNFYIKTTVKRRTKLTGRFRWSKYPSSYWGWLNPGDISLRKQSGDTKEFVGMQATDDPYYFGEREADIQAAMADPVEAMTLYGKLIGRCCYCGKTLTDHESKALGIGPDCFVNKYVPYLHARNARV